MQYEHDSLVVDASQLRAKVAALEQDLADLHADPLEHSEVLASLHKSLTPLPQKTIWNTA